MTEYKIVGVGFFELLAVLFIGLKLAHVIDWSWFWVLSPILIPIGVVLIIIVLGAFAIGVISIANAIKYKKLYGKTYKLKGD